MKIFNIDENEMNKNSAIFTLKEIYQQPKTWLKTLAQIIENKDSIQEFINQVIKCDDYDVIFTGAGTSEFVGNALYAYLNKELNYKVKSYGTTDIVATPEAYISKNKPTLLYEVAAQVCLGIDIIIPAAGELQERDSQQSRLDLRKNDLTKYAELTGSIDDGGLGQRPRYRHKCLTHQEHAENFEHGRKNQRIMGIGHM